MTIEFICNNCNSTLRVPDEHAGKKAKCPQCQGLNPIPAGDSRLDSGRSPFSAQESRGESPFGEMSGGGMPSSPASQSNPYAARQGGMQAKGIQSRQHQQPHRGSMVLTLGILALVCNFMLVPGICAWVMGRADLKLIDAGQMDPEGRGSTHAGMILGIIGTLLVALGGLLYFGLIMLIILFAG